MAASDHLGRRGPARARRLALAVAACVAVGVAVAGARASMAPRHLIEPQLAELPEGFDDYTPPRASERLPSEDGGGTGGQGGATIGGQGGGGTGSRLTRRHILGTWCSATSTYIIQAGSLVVILPRSASRSTYRVTGFDFTATTAVVRWISGADKAVRTTFGRFSADGKTMVQLAPNRTYRRCVLGAPLGYTHILGVWCDVNSKYVITRTQLRVILAGGREVSYRVSGFRFLKDVVEMNWTNSAGKPALTRFGRYSADRQRMVQLGPNRAYRRC